MAWITPKLDWSPNDFINFDDFNRIENNIIDVRNFLNSIQYNIPALTTVTNRTYSSIDFLSSINRIEQNLESIRNNFMTPAGYGGSETWIAGKAFDYTDAIRLEQNVKMLLETGVLVFESFKYCGTFNSGQTGRLA